MQIFQWNNVNGKIELNTPEILLIKEFSVLFDNNRNKCKLDPTGTLHLRAMREFTYIWLMLDWQSIIADYLEADRNQEALKDSGLTKEEFDDPDFLAACRKYREIQDSNRAIRMLTAAQGTVDKFVDYFTNIDPEERDEVTNKPIYKVKDIMAEISNLSKVYDELKALESQVKKELAEKSTLRGGATDGFVPLD